MHRQANALKPNKYSAYNYKQVVECVTKLFSGVRNSIFDHFKFNSRNQREGETLSDYTIELQNLAEHCEFKDFLDTMLRDRFVVGIREAAMKKVLLNKQSATSYSKFVECAISEEMVG